MSPSNYRPAESTDSAHGADPEDGLIPTERTRLLSPTPEQPGPWLSPDDPAVTPYNLWSVRILRIMTMVLATVTSIWFFALLVSMFATPPGMNVRGSVFWSLAYTVISLVMLVAILLFFDAPATSSRVLTVAISAVLVVDAVLVLAVEQVRLEEGWVGVVSVLWTFLISLWVLLVDITVKWGKAEEEVRLTGRPESRRTAIEWLEVVLSNITLSALLVVLVFTTTNLILRSIDAALAPPGTRYWVDGGKYRIHVHCVDSSSADPDSKSTSRPKDDVPTILIIGGEVPAEDGLWQVAQHALHNQSIPRYCLIDRPGYAWSDSAPSPLSASMSVASLTEALTLAGETGPWIVAGAGTGSFYARIFAQQQGPEAVKGLLLVDPIHEDYLPKLGSAARGFGQFLHGLVTPLGIMRIPGAVLRGRNREDRVWGRTAGQSSKTAFAILQENLVAGTLTEREVRATRMSLREWSVPLGLVSSGDMEKRVNNWGGWQRDLATLTRDLIGWETVDGAPHRVWKTEGGRNAIEGMMRNMVDKY